jgi:hypothetical protein
MRLLALVVWVFILATSSLYSQQITYIWDLASLHESQYTAIFNNAVTPIVSDFRGHKFNGFILYVVNKETGAIVYKMYTGKPWDGSLNAQALTFQKRFYSQDNAKGESGINFWPVKGEESMPMRIYLSPCISNPRVDSLKIDYNIASNDPVTQRTLIDEVRQIPNTNLYLGKMYYRILGKPCLFLWFALERRE